MLKLNIGCGIRHRKGFTNVDKYVTKEHIKQLIKEGHKLATIEKGSKYVQADWKDLPFEDNSVDYLESVDTIEHFGFREIDTVIKETKRVMHPGSMARIQTIDFNALVERWYKEITKPKIPQLEVYMDLMQCIYGNQHNEGQFHKMPWTPAYAHQLFIKEYEFSSINILIFPRFCGNAPPMETVDWDFSKVFRSQMMIMEIIK